MREHSSDIRFSLWKAMGLKAESRPGVKLSFVLGFFYLSIIGCSTFPGSAERERREISEQIEMIEARLESEDLGDDERAELLYRVGMLYQQRAENIGDVVVERDWTNSDCFLAPEFAENDRPWSENVDLNIQTAVYLHRDEPPRTEPAYTFRPGALVSHTVEFPEAHCAASRWERGVGYWSKEDYRSSIERLEELRLGYPNHEESSAAFLYAGEALAMSDHERVAYYYWTRGIWEKDYEVGQHLETVWLYLGEISVQTYEMNSAREYFTQVVTRETSAANYARYMLGWIEVIDGNYEQARDWFGELVRPTPADGTRNAEAKTAAVTGLAATYAAEGLPIDEARQFIASRVEENHEVRAFLRNLTDYCGEMGEPSFRCYEKTDEIELELAGAYFDDGMEEEAIELAGDLCERGFESGCEFVDDIRSRSR